VDATGMVTWTDPTPALDSAGKANAVTKGNAQNEIGFRVERAPVTGSGLTATVGQFAALAAATPVVDSRINTLANATSFKDKDILAANTDYQYQVVAVNEGGEIASAPFTLKFALLAPVVSGMSMTVNGVPQTTISWTNTSTGEASYTVERCAGTTTSCVPTSAAWVLLGSNLSAGNLSYVDTTTTGSATYLYRVKAVNGATVGPAGNSAQITAATTVAAPASLVATSANGANVVLTWVDSSNNENAFSVMRSPANTNSFVALGSVTRSNTLKTATAGAVTFTDATVVTGIAYDYQVVASNTTGTTVSNSVPSNTATITPQVAAPTGLAANVAAGTMVLNWVDSSTNETGFQVTRTGGAGGSVVFTTPARGATLTKAVGGAVTYTDTTALPLASYTYTVAAVTSAAGAVPVVTGAVSAPVTATLALNAPTTVSAAQTATGITVTWTDNANNDIGYQIVRTGGAVAPTTINVTSTAAQKTATAAARTYIDTTAVAGVNYSYSVATTGGSTLAPVYSAAVASNAVVALVAAPGVPTAAITNATRITLAWTDLATNETGFLIERSTDGGKTFAVVTTLARTAAAMKNTNVAVSYVDNLVAPIAQGSYQYRVTAVNQTGTVTNASSAPVLSNLLDFTAPVAPTALLATAAATTTVSLSWTDNAATETGFSVQRATNALFTTGLTTTAVAVATAGTGGSTSYLATGLTKGKSYFFRVAAINLVGTSAYSAAATIVAP